MTNITHIIKIAHVIEHVIEMGNDNVIEMGHKWCKHWLAAY